MFYRAPSNMPKSIQLSHILTAEAVDMRLRSPVLYHLKWLVQVLKLPWTRDDWERERVHTYR